MADGGTTRGWLSLDLRYGRFPAYSLPPTRSGNATGNTMRVHPDNTVWLPAIAPHPINPGDPPPHHFTTPHPPVAREDNQNATPQRMPGGGEGNSPAPAHASDHPPR